jgi:hypothetical protein
MSLNVSPLNMRYIGLHTHTLLSWTLEFHEKDIQAEITMKSFHT